VACCCDFSLLEVTTTKMRNQLLDVDVLPLSSGSAAVSHKSDELGSLLGRGRKTPLPSGFAHQRCNSLDLSALTAAVAKTPTTGTIGPGAAGKLRYRRFAGLCFTADGLRSATRDGKLSSRKQDACLFFAAWM